MTVNTARYDPGWTFVRTHLPAPPARVVEIGCGPDGGFVPALLRAGHRAVGVDPAAPEGEHYERIPFERHERGATVDVIVASTSLHHVGDLGEVLDHAADLLKPGGTIVVIEFAHELFDEATARWCFEHLPEPGEQPGWLHGHRAGWAASGRSWPDYRASWVRAEAMHGGTSILRALDARFSRVQVADRLPYFFPDLAGVEEADEQAAIDADRIQGTGFRYVGERRRRHI
ncbi:class I SAM-dependent methyltransferase [Pseudonocardia sp. TRM90224]|uniref:class I SAM-dependent methyltransferase n=1 Tax=Pseudonocardia sp. TRM90224 TaxID=2812678 RepID=UPI001E3906F0|nr:class I SAM-dependent methyltransferase [Pseudonocardia sp. TRM90224]